MLLAMQLCSILYTIDSTRYDRLVTKWQGVHPAQSNCSLPAISCVNIQTRNPLSIRCASQLSDTSPLYDVRAHQNGAQHSTRCFV